MRSSKGLWGMTVTGAVLLTAHMALAEGGGAAVQKIGHGEINWADGFVMATGSAAPDKNAANIAAARLGAERAAKLDAMRNVLEVIKGANVTAKVTAGEEMSSNGAISAKVQGLVKAFKVVDTKYYSDGSVDVVLRVELKGELSDALIPDVVKPVAVPEKGTPKNTGLIVNAKGLQALPALAPRLLDEKGDEVYGASVVSEAAVKENGIAGYVKDVDAAKDHARVKGSPMVIKAIKVASPGKSDLVISNEDAAKLRDQGSNLSYLAQGKVIIIID